MKNEHLSVNHNSNQNNMIREGAYVTVFTFLGKIIGFVREWILAFFFGTTLVADALRIAIDISTHVWGILFGSTVEATMVPLVVRWRTRRAVRSADYLIRLLAWGGVSISVFLAFLIAIFADWITCIQAPTFSAVDSRVVTLMIRWITPSIPLVVSCNLMGYLLFTVNRFRIFSLLPIFLNVGLIGSVILVGSGWAPSYWLAIGYDVALVVTLIALVIDARAWFPRKVRSTMKRAVTILTPFFANILPLIILGLFFQSRIFIDKRIASGIGVGAVAALYYARFIIEAPAQTIGLALTRIVLPHFSVLVQKRENIEIGQQFLVLLNLSLWLLLPLVVLLASVAKPLMTVIFGYGQFGDRAISLTALALLGFSPGVWVQLINPLCNRIFNAQGRNRLLMTVSVSGILFNIAAAFTLVHFWGVAGVAFANIIAQFLVTMILIPYLPGKITPSAFYSIGKWWIIALALYFVLSFIPMPHSPLLTVLFTAGVIGVVWVMLTYTTQEGRELFAMLRNTVRKH